MLGYGEWNEVGVWRLDWCWVIGRGEGDWTFGGPDIVFRFVAVSRNLTGRGEGENFWVIWESWFKNIQWKVDFCYRLGVSVGQCDSRVKVNGDSGSLVEPSCVLNVLYVPRGEHTNWSVVKTRQLVLYREIIAVCSQIHTKHINTVFGRNVELFNVKLVVHIVTTGLQRVKFLLGKPVI